MIKNIQNITNELVKMENYINVELSVKETQQLKI